MFSSPECFAPRRFLNMPPSRVALCLNSSFLGFFAHAGFLEALTAFGVRPVALSGASAGAIVAGAHAAGMEPRAIVEWMLGGDLKGAFREWGSPWRMLATFLNRPGHTGALRGHRGLELLRERLGDRRIEECPLRLAIAATDLTRGRAAMLTAGPLAEAILASAAFPGMFAAQRIDGALYWDGGVADPIPFEHWIGDPAIDTILVHVVTNPGDAAARNAGDRHSIVTAGGLAHQILCDELLRLKTEMARRAGQRVVFLRTLAPRPLPWNTARIGPRCVEIGAETVDANRDILAAL